MIYIIAWDTLITLTLLLKNLSLYFNPSDAKNDARYDNKGTVAIDSLKSSFNENVSLSSKYNGI